MFRSRNGQSIAAVAALLSWSLNAGAQSVGLDANAEGSAKAGEEAEADAAAEGAAEQDSAEEEEAAAAAAVERAPEPAAQPEPEPDPEPQPQPVKKAAPESDEGSQTDHQKVVGSLGIGYFGVTQLRNTTTGFGIQTLNVPMIGARYWYNDFLGVQVGGGFATASGVRKDDIAGNEDTNDSTTWNTAFEIGTPLSLYSGDHYNFLVLPELFLGYSSGRTKDNLNVPLDQGVKQAAWTFGGSVRAGAEIQFGFIGIPDLSLQGAVGVQATYWTAMIETVEDGQLVRRNYQSFNAGTANYNEPWDLFVGSVAALYYFDL